MKTSLILAALGSEGRAIYKVSIIGMGQPFFFKSHRGTVSNGTSHEPLNVVHLKDR